MTDIRFEEFTIDAAALELRRAGERVPLTPQGVRVLLYLLGRRGDLVTRRELCDEIWGPDNAIDVDRALNTLVRQIRRALGDATDAPRFIQTYPGRGYRLLAPQAPVAGRRRQRPVLWVLVGATAAVLSMFLLPRTGPVQLDELPAAVREDYLLGRHLLEQPDASQRAKAARLMQEVARRAPAFAPAQVELAFAHAWGARWDEARAALSSAFELDSSVARAWMVSSFIALVHDWDWVRADADLRRALAIAPDDAELLASHGFVLATAGRRDSAAIVLDRARALDPVSAIVVADIGQIYRYIGREAEAAEACGRANEMAAEPAFALECVLDARQALGDLQGARRAATRIVVAASSDPLRVLGSARVDDRAALDRYAQWSNARAEEMIRTGSYPPFAAAISLTRASRTQDAIAALAREASHRGLGFVTATVEPAFAALRANPGYLELVAPLVRGGAAAPNSGG